VIKVSEETEGNVLILEAEGKLTDQDYKDLVIPRLESIIREHGKARLLLDMGDDFQGWQWKAFWDDAWFGLTHRRDFEKMAVLADRRWVQWALKAGALVIQGELRTFSPSQRAEAHHWIKAQPRA
jgi:hypothetical protein